MSIETFVVYSDKFFDKLGALCAFLIDMGYMENCSTEKFSKKERVLIDEYDAQNTFKVTSALWDFLQLTPTTKTFSIVINAKNIDIA